MKPLYQILAIRRGEEIIQHELRYRDVFLGRYLSDSKAKEELKKHFDRLNPETKELTSNWDVINGKLEAYI